MFSTFRQRLLFWFLVFISAGVLIIALSIFYLQQREQILRTSERIDAAYVSLLKSVLLQQEFFSYETINSEFFETGHSTYLDRYQSTYDSTLAFITAAEQLATASQFKLETQISEQTQALQTSDQLFKTLVQKVKKRGFKDYSLVGEMRKEAHWLEENQGISSSSILSLRRHEKDYIIRNEASYVEKFNTLLQKIKEEVSGEKRHSNSWKDSLLYHLNQYGRQFNALVEINSEIGIKDNSALKQELDTRIHDLEDGFEALVVSAKKRKEDLFRRLNWLFGGLTGFLILTSIAVSYWISRSITKPLTELTIYITRFVDSNFTLETQNPIVKTSDEIGKLTENFKVLKDEVITRLKFFKQKVDERTQELADANAQLVRVNEANSRFVPQAFLHFLGKNSIEEVRLGDQIEQEMTIMFTDIRSFTQISEGLTPQENFDFINNYLNRVVPLIQENHGFIDKYIGDSIMALFPDSPYRALQAAIRFDEVLQAFNEDQTRIGRPAIQVGVGIHTGRLILGTIGHNDRLETTVISDAVNIASRVEGLTKHYKAKIIATSTAVEQLPEDHPLIYRLLDRVKVKGKSESISVYEFLTPRDHEKLAYQPAFQVASDALFGKDAKKAVQLFQEILTQNPEDGAVQILLSRSQYFLENGYPDNWDGVAQMTTK